MIETGRRSRSAPLPLSASQTRLWHLSQFAPSSPAFNELVTIRKAGPLDVRALRRALTDVVARHEVWRTTFKTIDHDWMVGQFYPGHQQGGLRNPNFKALDGPFAMLAVRHMVVTDYPFLCEDEKWTDAYLARFAPEVSAGCPLGDAVSRRAAL
jgi:hypothetical protein